MAGDYFYFRSCDAKFVGQEIAQFGVRLPLFGNSRDLDTPGSIRLHLDDFVAGTLGNHLHAQTQRPRGFPEFIDVYHY
jgi:hypothetical protein